jgi:hypothetical protein
VAKRAKSDRWLRRGGFALGLAAAAGGLLAARVPAAPPGLGFDLTVVPTAPKTLTLRPPGPLLTAPGLRAGGKPGEGGVTVLNPTARPEQVRVRAVPSSKGIDNVLMVELTADGRAIYRGPLGGLREPPGPPLVLESGDGVEVRLRAWLPSGARGWRGQIEDLTLTFDAAPAQAR